MLLALLAPLAVVAALSVAAVLVAHPGSDELPPLPWERLRVERWLIPAVVVAIVLVLYAVLTQGSGARR